jgi:hypothetical protein
MKAGVGDLEMDLICPLMAIVDEVEVEKVLNQNIQSGIGSCDRSLGINLGCTQLKQADKQVS